MKHGLINLIKHKKEFCPNCGSNKFYEYPSLLDYYFCDDCKEEMVLEEGQYYLSDDLGNAIGNALKPKGFVFR